MLSAGLAAGAKNIETQAAATAARMRDRLAAAKELKGVVTTRVEESWRNAAAAATEAHEDAVKNLWSGNNLEEFVWVAAVTAAIGGVMLRRRVLNRPLSKEEREEAMLKEKYRKHVELAEQVRKKTP